MTTNVNNWVDAYRVAKTEKVLVQAHIANSKLTFMGASCPTSVVSPMTSGLTSFYIMPRQGKQDVVALRLYCEGEDVKRNPPIDHFYLVPASFNDEPRLELKRDFSPLGTLLPQLTIDGLFVTAGDQKFVAPLSLPHRERHDAERAADWAKQGVRIVPDANLLCRFIVGDATLDEVIAKAEALEVELAWPARYAALAERLNAAEQLAGQLDTWASRCGWLVLQLEEAKGKLAKVDVKLNELHEKSRNQEVRIRSDANRLNQLEATIKLIAREAEESAGFGHRSRTLDWIRSYGLNALVVKNPAPSSKGAT